MLKSPRSLSVLFPDESPDDSAKTLISSFFDHLIQTNQNMFANSQNSKQYRILELLFSFDAVKPEAVRARTQHELHTPPRAFWGLHTAANSIK